MAIISNDGFIADENGSMDKIAHDYDFICLQKRLDAFAGYAYSVVGRVTHEKHKNRSKRNRYILSTRQMYGLSCETFFNNKNDLVEKVTQNDCDVHFILGGSNVYTMFGEEGLYDDFYLSIRPDILLETGVPLDMSKDFTDAKELMNSWGLSKVENITPPLYPVYPDLKMYHFER